MFSPSSLANPAVALFYGEKAPLAELKAFAIAGIEPDHSYHPVRYRTPDSELFAYVAAAEVQPSRSYVKEIPAYWKMARNGDRGSALLNQAPAKWPDLFANTVAGPLWAKGYPGFELVQRRLGFIAWLTDQPG